MSDKALKIKKEKKERIKQCFRLVGLVVLAVFLVAATVVVFPWLNRISDLESSEARQTLQELRGYADLAGGWKYPLALFLQVLQIVVAILPGGPMQIVMGFLFGTVGGAFLSLIGIVAATLFIVVGVRRYGKRFAKLFVKVSDFEKLSFLKNPRRREILFFLLFLIPGTPKDLLTYFAPFTDIPTARLIAIVSIARIPSLLSSTYVGATLSGGGFQYSLLAFSITAVLGICGLLFYDRFIEFYQKRKKKSVVNNENDDRK